jgi:hypothetical protein
MGTRAVAVSLCLLAGTGFAADDVHGKRETLAEVVRHCSEKGSAALPALKLSAAEQTDLVVFLESISTLSNPWRPEDHGRCQ